MSNFKKIVILAGDILLFYAALIVMLAIRYPQYSAFGKSFQNHLLPFSVILFFWLVIFFLTEVYSPRTLQNRRVQFSSLSFAFFLSIIVSIIVFYLFQGLFELTPKTNLVLFAMIFFVLDYPWRIAIIKTYIAKGLQTKILAIGTSPNLSALSDYLRSNPQLGFLIAHWEKADALSSVEALLKIIQEKKIDAIVIDENILETDKSEMLRLAYHYYNYDITVNTSSDFFETIFGKIPLKSIDERWFVKNMSTRKKTYEVARAVMDFILALILLVLLLPMELAIALLVKATSPGSVLYKQTRMGQYNKPFTLYKFRSMRVGEDGPLWTEQNDARLTRLGKFLRFTHLDEIPQLLNVLRRDISFIGPRPERWELARQYSSLPYYSMRHAVKPGITGWAQINFKPSASPEEAYEKLCYDIFYLKNRSFFLDFVIIIKTIRYIFASAPSHHQTANHHGISNQGTSFPK